MVTIRGNHRYKFLEEKEISAAIQKESSAEGYGDPAKCPDGRADVDSGPLKSLSSLVYMDLSLYFPACNFIIHEIYTHIDNS